MGQPLFKFDDGYIAAVAFGLDDGDTASIFAAAYEAGRAELRQSIVDRARSAPDWSDDVDEIQLRWKRDGMLVVHATDDQMEREYGTSDIDAQPIIRQGLNNGRQRATRAMERVLNG